MRYLERYKLQINANIFAMAPKQDTLDDIIQSEYGLTANAAKKYGDYFTNALEFNELLQTFTESVDASRHIFAAFLSQVRKHLTLAILSTVRLHHIQTTMNVRQALEAGLCAAYAIANPEQEGFVLPDENGYLTAPQELIGKRNKWLEENFPKGPDAIKNLKGLINKNTAHANLIYAYQNFDFDKESGKFHTPFFDIEKEHLVKTDLWEIANIAMGLMDLFYGIDKNIGSIKFIDDFIPRLHKLEADNLRLKKEMQAFLDQRIKNHTKAS
ncbi:MAG: hypothetical protein AAB681_03105 [Patescibacteria group bacterium]